eukprot:358653-Chlamydomonas_euryale.AAC.1
MSTCGDDREMPLGARPRPVTRPCVKCGKSGWAGGGRGAGPEAAQSRGWRRAWRRPEAAQSRGRMLAWRRAEAGRRPGQQRRAETLQSRLGRGRCEGGSANRGSGMRCGGECTELSRTGHTKGLDSWGRVLAHLAHPPRPPHFPHPPSRLRAPGTAASAALAMPIALFPVVLGRGPALAVPIALFPAFLGKGPAPALPSHPVPQASLRGCPPSLREGGRGSPPSLREGGRGLRPPPFCAECADCRLSTWLTVVPAIYERVVGVKRPPTERAVAQAVVKRAEACAGDVHLPTVEPTLVANDLSKVPRLSIDVDGLAVDAVARQRQLRQCRLHLLQRAHHHVAHDVKPGGWWRVGSGRGHERRTCVHWGRRES